MTARPKRPVSRRRVVTYRPAAHHLAGWALAAIVVAAILLARFTGDQQRAGSRHVLPDSLAALDPIEAYRQAVALQKEHRSHASLPYFRRALAGRSGDWRLRLNYSAALNEATLESRALGGLAVPVTRNSVERVALQREALAQLSQAERLATSPEERAFVIAARGQRYVTWGFPLEAREEFARAARFDPSWRGVLVALDRRLADPTRPDSIGP